LQLAEENEKCIQISVGKPQAKGSLARFTQIWKNNIKMDLTKTGFDWLMIWSNGGSFWNMIMNIKLS